MRVKTHRERPTPTSMTLETSPMSVWLSREIELQIEKGDRLKDVVAETRKHWKLGPKRAARLVAYWFALGERVSAAGEQREWSKKELASDPKRRYSPSTATSEQV